MIVNLPFTYVKTVTTSGGAPDSIEGAITVTVTGVRVNRAQVANGTTGDAISIDSVEQGFSYDGVELLSDITDSMVTVQTTTATLSAPSGFDGSGSTTAWVFRSGSVNTYDATTTGSINIDTSYFYPNAGAGAEYWEQFFFVFKYIDGTPFAPVIDTTPIGDSGSGTSQGNFPTGIAGFRPQLTKVLYDLKTSQIKVFKSTPPHFIHDDDDAVGHMTINGTTKTFVAADDANALVFDGPFDDPIGKIALYSTRTISNEQTITIEYDLQPFIFPEQIKGHRLNGSGELALLFDGWATFEKSFGFNDAVENVRAFGIDGEPSSAPRVVSKDDGFYMPDLAVETELNSIGSTDGNSKLFYYYTQNVVKTPLFLQLCTDDRKLIMPSVQNGLAAGAPYINQQVEMRSVTKPTKFFHTDHAVSHSASKVLMPDGSVRLLVSKVIEGGFDLYNVSNGGTLLMFDDLWDENYHGAQIAYLLDGTLVSYAWEIIYTPPTEDDDGFITYSLYFKRSLNDGAMWEIAILAADQISSINGLPILVQDIKTGKLNIGGVISDDMGLTWH